MSKNKVFADYGTKYINLVNHWCFFKNLQNIFQPSYLHRKISTHTVTFVFQKCFCNSIKISLLGLTKRQFHNMMLSLVIEILNRYIYIILFYIFIHFNFWIIATWPALISHLYTLRMFELHNADKRPCLHKQHTTARLESVQRCARLKPLLHRNVQHWNWYSAW